MSNFIVLVVSCLGLFWVVHRVACEECTPLPTECQIEDFKANSTEIDLGQMPRELFCKYFTAFKTCANTSKTTCDKIEELNTKHGCDCGEELAYCLQKASNDSGIDVAIKFDKIEKVPFCKARTSFLDCEKDLKGKCKTDKQFVDVIKLIEKTQKNLKCGCNSIIASMVLVSFSLFFSTKFS